MLGQVFRSALFSILFLSVASGLRAASPSSEAQTPETLVGALYKQHDKKSPFFQTENRALLDRFFAKPLAGAIWKDAKESQGEVGAISFDPLYDAQDTDITYFTIHEAKVQGDKATVAVTFSNFGKKVKITYALEAQGDAWKITDIRYAKGLSLAGLLAGNH